MAELWITKAGRFAVRKHECPHPGVPVDLLRPRSGVGHTTEGSFNSALSVFEQHFAPHFLVAADQILQLVPLGMEASSLEHDTNLPFETNRWAHAQIEVVANSDLDVWLPNKPTLDRFEALLWQLQKQMRIPLIRPFPNRLQHGVTWATPSNPRRTVSPAKWGVEAGWYMHLEIPGNAHWDMGNLEWETVLTGAKHAGARPKFVLRGGAGHIVGHTKKDTRRSLNRHLRRHPALLRDHDTLTIERTTK